MKCSGRNEISSEGGGGEEAGRMIWKVKRWHGTFWCVLAGKDDARKRQKHQKPPNQFWRGLDRSGQLQKLCDSKHLSRDGNPMNRPFGKSSKSSIKHHSCLFSLFYLTSVMFWSNPKSQDIDCSSNLVQTLYSHYQLSYQCFFKNNFLE